MDVGKQQAAFTASKQEASKQLQRLLTEGQRVADVIRTVVKDHFGPREEKIAELTRRAAAFCARTHRPSLRHRILEEERQRV
ncbi:MAG: hypothetical protein QOF89_1723 [Acidobacteriota bacterium]|jgi:hypothetical protein|nr:hypothetical protein [Acidobacteriota bacterium]